MWGKCVFFFSQYRIEALKRAIHAITHHASPIHAALHWCVFPCTYSVCLSASAPVYVHAHLLQLTVIIVIVVKQDMFSFCQLTEWLPWFHLHRTDLKGRQRCFHLFQCHWLTLQHQTGTLFSYSCSNDFNPKQFGSLRSGSLIFHLIWISITMLNKKIPTLLSSSSCSSSSTYFTSLFSFTVPMLKRLTQNCFQGVIAVISIVSSTALKVCDPAASWQPPQIAPVHERKSVW